jgi:hypothetical protein
MAMSEEHVEVGSRRPVAKFAAGGVSIAIWKNQRQADGRTWDAYSAQIQNRFYDEASREWRDSDYFSPSNLADLLLVTLRALEVVRLRGPDTAPTDSPAAGPPS